MSELLQLADAPNENPGSSPLKPLLWGLLALFLATMAGLGTIDQGLRVPASPLGIVSFEFCGFADTCDAALSQWGARGQQLAMLSLGVDYLYLLVYSSLIWVCLQLCLPGLSPSLQRPTRLIAGLPFVAAAADAAENGCLIQIVLGDAHPLHGPAAGVFATFKFALLGIALAWLLFACLARRQRSTAPA